MNSMYYDTQLSINDCLAALLGLDVERIRSAQDDLLLNEIEEDLSQAVEELYRAHPPSNPNHLDALLTEAQKASTQYSQAIIFHTRIVGEIAKHRAGGMTELVVTLDSQFEPGDYSRVRIDRQSFIDWAFETFTLQLAADDLSIVEQHANSDSASSDRKYTDNDRDKHEVIIALLLEELGPQLGGAYMEAGKPNCAQLGELVSESCKQQCIKVSGLSAQTLRKKFSAAMKKKEEHLPS